MKQRGPNVVHAAGALVWREKHGELQVLAVHRPRYNDWSWPKGKLDPGETLPTCAIREVAEETQKQVLLGVPLPTLAYPLASGQTKVVHYWAARVLGKVGPAFQARPKFKAASKNEIDKVRWLSVAQARELITFADDLVPLEKLVALHTQKLLRTHVFVIARHARARRRKAWSGSDDERPLTSAGAQRAQQLVPLFSAFGVSQVSSSLARRCTDTVGPYAAAAGLKVKTYRALTERRYQQDPAGTSEVIAKLWQKQVNRLVCVHRPTMPAVFSVLADSMQSFTRGRLPRKNPYLPAGGVLVAHLRESTSGPEIVALETHLLM